MDEKMTDKILEDLSGMEHYIVDTSQYPIVERDLNAVEVFRSQLKEKIKRVKDDLFLLRSETPSSMMAIGKAKGRINAYEHSLYLLEQVIEHMIEFRKEGDEHESGKSDDEGGV